MNILLVGSTGLLGHNVLLRLLEQGHTVYAPVRNSHAIRIPKHPNLHIIGFDTICRLTPELGISAIVNCAGVTDMSLLSYDDYLPINRDLCGTLTGVMESLQISTLVHVSTANTIGHGTADSPADESREMAKPFADSFYARSKREGEQLLMDYAFKHPSAHVVILNPGFMIGAYDTKPSSGKLLLAAYRMAIMAAPCGGKSFVHVADVADAVVNALTKGRNGERYLLTGLSLSLRDFYKLQASVCGYRQHFFVLPKWLVAAAGAVGSMLRLLHVPTQLSLTNVRQLMVMEYYSCAKAESELGYKLTPIDRAIKDFFDWQQAANQK